jgi:hypothetical protein
MNGALISTYKGRKPEVTLFFLYCRPNLIIAVVILCVSFNFSGAKPLTSTNTKNVKKNINVTNNKSDKNRTEAEKNKLSDTTIQTALKNQQLHFQFTPSVTENSSMATFFCTNPAFVGKAFNLSICHGSIISHSFSQSTVLGRNEIFIDLNGLTNGEYIGKIYIDSMLLDSAKISKVTFSKYELTIVPSHFDSDATLSYTMNSPKYIGMIAKFNLYKGNCPACILIESFEHPINEGKNEFFKPEWNYLQPSNYSLSMNCGKDTLETITFLKKSNSTNFNLTISPHTVLDSCTIQFQNNDENLIGSKALFEGKLDTTLIFNFESVIVKDFNSISYVIPDEFPSGKYKLFLIVNSSYNVDSVEFVKHNKISSLSFYPSTVDFKKVLVNMTKTQGFTLHNSGNINAIIDSVSNNSRLFNVITTLPLTLPPNSFKNVSVIFTPISIGQMSDTIKFYNVSNKLQQIHTVPVTGQGTLIHNWDLNVYPKSFAKDPTISFLANPNFIKQQVMFKLSGINPNTAKRDSIETFKYTITNGSNALHHQLWNFLPSGQYELEMFNNTGTNLFDRFQFYKTISAIDMTLRVSPQFVSSEMEISFVNKNPYFTKNNYDIVIKNSTGATLKKSNPVLNGMNRITFSLDDNIFVSGKYTAQLIINNQQIDSISFTKVNKDNILQITPGNIYWGVIEAGSTVSATVNALNISGSSVVISNITAPDSSLAFREKLPLTILPNQTQKLTFSMSFKKTGNKNIAITVTAISGNDVQNIKIPVVTNVRTSR